MGLIDPSAAVIAERPLASGWIGTNCRNGLDPSRRVENVHKPTDHASSNRPRPLRAAEPVTCSRFWPRAEGTADAIEPDTSITASIRPGTVTADQADSAWSTCSPGGAGLVLSGPSGIPGRA